MTEGQRRALQAIADATYSMTSRHGEAIARRANDEGKKMGDFLRPSIEAGLVTREYIGHSDWTEYSLTPAGWEAIERTPPIWEGEE